jgi:hypothetical protein
MGTGISLSGNCKKRAFSHKMYTMDFNWWIFGIDTLTILLLLLVLVFSIGVVWRTEKKLDLSYKFFVLAAGCLTLGEVLGFYAGADSTTMVLVGKSLRFVGALSFLFSVLFMRDIVRVLDHEKPGRVKEEG